MREILFRGKQIDNGEWNEGSLWVHLNKPYIMTTANVVGYEVDPETVGQYTGITDKNGVKIFEGDVVLCDRHINDEFDKKTFFVREIYPISGLIGESLSGNEICGDDWEFAEVIGNIHDNPEILKEGGEE